MKKKILITSIIIICAGLLAVYFKFGMTKVVKVGGSIASVSRTELIQRSALIVKGEAAEILPSKWSNPDFVKGKGKRNIIQTDIKIKVDKVFKGNLDKDYVVVRIDKGKVGNTEYISEGYPDFKVGKKLVLFLSRDDSDIKTDEDYYVLTGMNQGYFAEKTQDSYVNVKGDEVNINNFKEEIDNIIK